MVLTLCAFSAVFVGDVEMFSIHIYEHVQWYGVCSFDEYDQNRHKLRIIGPDGTPQKASGDCGAVTHSRMAQPSRREYILSLPYFIFIAGSSLLHNALPLIFK